MKRRAFLAALAAWPLVPSLASSAPETGFHVFGRLPPPERIQRVFVAGPPAAVLVYVLAPGKLLGWPQQLAGEARAYLAPEYRDLPFLGRLAGRGSTLPLERLVALKPDLVIDAGTVDGTYLSTAERVWRQTGIPYLLVDGRLADSARQLRETGRLLGVAERGRMLADYAAATLSACAIGGPRPRVYLARGADGLETPVAGSVNGECIEAACGINVASAVGGGLARVSPEQILAWAPDVVVSQYAEFFAHARDDAFWRRLPAVREGRLLLAPHQPFGWLDGPPGVNRLIGVRWLADHLRSVAQNTDWIAQAQAFHELFYGHRPERAELARLPGLT